MTTLFQEVKELVLIAEELEKDQKAYPQILIEYRNALDHLFRVFADKLNLYDPPNPQDHTIKSLDKAFGHIYRAGYDVLDLLNIEYYRKIQEIVTGKSSKTITEVFPEYYRSIKPAIEEKKEKIARLRNKKDLDNETNNAENYFENFEQYRKLINEISVLYKEVRNKQPSLEEFHNKIKKEKWIKYIGAIVGPTIATIIGIIIGYFLK
jgi:glycosidase